MLIRDDFPTLLLPIKAYSGIKFFGHFSTSELLITNSAVFITILFSYTCGNFIFRIKLNLSGCSIIAACPHLSIQNNSESGKSLSNSSATSGGVTVSFLPQIMQVGVFILGKSFAILCLIALFAIASVLISLFLSFTVS